ncbi:MAG: hypothetical protein COV10_01180 [Candidatus Vogelbacteria bacterium CG10_big_fil_rev_8_21_14_0_10_51_16]|uniref:Type II secretion system protein GspF domain-containing protein n=1 Tax=Candidatus Vogelbacteria bacterium CG10_big_fil_rev_8_21_14_0_10_51_16 TaxID=1975045 RepID=A0A2H0RFB4_9BACT|nr:MAG: hypothetical protein COV10_01180 [Candidatus Vogelbacteria bacterium CG10_big_fil_rev_8_21_14_0_10_51_16]
MLFFYKAVSAGGATLTGEREASDKFALAHQLREEGLTVFFAQARNAGTTRHSFAYWNERVVRITLRDKITFAQNLAAMLDAGLALSRALSVILKQTKNKRFKRIIASVAEGVDGGMSFHEALARHVDVFPPVFVAMVEAGEQSGKLPGALTLVSDQLMKAYTLQKKIKGAMIYPAVILVIMAIIGVLMLIYVVPTLTKTFSQLGTKLPASTEFILATSSFFANNLLLIVIGLIVLITLFIFWARTGSGRRALHLIFIRMPVVGSLVREANTATTARTLSSLISSGVDMVAALDITARVVQNAHFQAVIREAGAVVQKGTPLASVFQARERIFPILMGEMVEVGEETGKLAEMMLKVALFYEEEVSQATKDLSTIIEPVLMVLIGGAVGFFAIAMIQPIYSISL